MEMLKFLTHKLRQQSLNEVQPFQPSQDEEDRDSGTESDEENAELQAMEEAMEQCVDLADTEDHDQENPPLGGATFPVRTPTISSSYPTVARRPFQLVNHQNSPFQVVAGPLMTTTTTGTAGKRYSVQDSSDPECCSLDCESATSSTDFDRHSSEEELTVINKAREQQHHQQQQQQQTQAEKRKWSQVHRCGSCNDSSGSSDEEVRDLLANPPTRPPVNFSSSPPRGVHKLTRTMSPRLFFSNVSPTATATVHLCTVSPRKRHRFTCQDGMDSGQRPCLDFEKMQRTLYRKHLHVTHGVSKARVVKIKSFTGSSRPPKGLYDPSVFSFRSISPAYNPLTPVEEPSCAF